jgi:putative ABC transport system permease protein
MVRQIPPLILSHPASRHQPAVRLSTFGGLIGIVLALARLPWLSAVLHVPFVFNGGIVLIAFLFSAVVGVIFGYFPELKAARLDPIVALRHE